MPYDKEGVSNVAVPSPLSKPSTPLRNMFELTKLTTFEPLGIKLAGSEFIYSSCENYYTHASVGHRKAQLHSIIKL